MKCSKCKQIIVSSGCGTGYGTNMEDEKICYTCCAEEDKEQMRKTGKIVLYLYKCSDNMPTPQLTNWPGTLKIPVNHIRAGSHNIAGIRYDVWFQFEGIQWHGTQYGNNTELCHCKRLKNKAWQPKVNLI